MTATGTPPPEHKTTSASPPVARTLTTSPHQTRDLVHTTHPFWASHTTHTTPLHTSCLTAAHPFPNPSAPSHPFALHTTSPSAIWRLLHSLGCCRLRAACAQHVLCLLHLSETSQRHFTLPRSTVCNSPCVECGVPRHLRFTYLDANAVAASFEMFTFPYPCTFLRPAAGVSPAGLQARNCRRFRCCWSRAHDF